MLDTIPTFRCFVTIFLLRCKMNELKNAVNKSEHVHLVMNGMLCIFDISLNLDF